jgi:hypothetical protein
MQEIVGVRLAQRNEPDGAGSDLRSDAAMLA